jgi:hypothetical protein
MRLDKLISWLSKHNIKVVEDTLQADGSRILQFSTELPRFPFGDRHVWATLVIDPGQERVSESEIETLLNHCWHGELEIPPPDDDER